MSHPFQLFLVFFLGVLIGTKCAFAYSLKLVKKNLKEAPLPFFLEKVGGGGCTRFTEEERNEQESTD